MSATGENQLAASEIQGSSSGLYEELNLQATKNRGLTKSLHPNYTP
jgi:hypothetical protein